MSVKIYFLGQLTFLHFLHYPIWAFEESNRYYPSQMYTPSNILPSPTHTYMDIILNIIPGGSLVKNAWTQGVSALL